MYVRRISVGAWRGLDCELADLSPALNLICGPNESGKSRLVQALRFALFESSKGRGRHKAALETWSTTGEKPRVAVDFELGGTTWMLEKTFLGTGCNTVLRGAGRTLEGEDAEARLAELMGVAPGGSAERKSSERGIWSLLWVDQGESQDAPAHNPTSHARLQDQLASEIGEVAAGPMGQRILRTAREHKEQFYTPKNDGERPVLRDARQKVEHLEAALAEARARHQAVARDADELERLRAREGDLARRIGEAEGELASLVEQHRQAVDAERALAGCRHDLELARIELDRHDQAWQTFAELSQQIQTLGDEIEALDQRRLAAAGAHDQADVAHRETARQLGELDDALAGLGRELQGLRQTQKAAALRHERDQLSARLEEAESLAVETTARRNALAELPAVTPEDVDRLREARQAVDEARARLEGASASVEITALQNLHLDGQPLAAGTSRTVLVEDEKHLEVSGVLAIAVRPGGGELARLRDAVADAEGAQHGLLTSLAVGGVREADRLAQQRRDLDGEIHRLREASRRLLPEGREEIDARLREIAAQLAALGPAADAPFDPRDLEQAEAREQARAREREQLRAQRDASAEALSRARDEARTLELLCTSKRDQLRGLRERLEQMPAREALDTKKAAAHRNWEEKVAARDTAQRRFDELGGEQLGLALRQAEQAVKQLRERHTTTQHDCLLIEGRLGSAGDDGRYERVQDLEAEVNQVRAGLERLEREAQAALRLYQVLNDEYHSARERLSQPVISRIRPYLAELFPGSEVWLDDEMNLLGMRGARVEEDFQSLSGGAREQLSLLVRIGLAEVIGAEETWPLVLDDVLVNTDAQRIRQVQRLLFQAARRMQILLFTCHGPLFDMLGPDQRIELAPVARQSA